MRLELKVWKEMTHCAVLLLTTAQQAEQQLLVNCCSDPLVLSVLQDVIQVSKKYLPGMAVGYSSAKLTLHVGDGFEFMKQNQEAFDVIITDSSDPMGKNSSHKRALLSTDLLFFFSSAHLLEVMPACSGSFQVKKLGCQLGSFGREREGWKP